MDGWYNAGANNAAPHGKSNMPIYCFRTNHGEVIERYFRMDEVPDLIDLDDGSMAIRDYKSERVSGNVKRRSERSRGWPLTCVGSGVNANQADELRKHLADRGCPTEISPDGDPIYTSAAHRRKALKIRGFIDKASYC